MSAERQLYGGPAAREEKRDVGAAIRTGFSGRCPRCGEGRLFAAWVKPVDDCANCGEELHHQRADDLPAYLVILLVGHLVIGLFSGVEAVTQWSMWTHLAIWAPVTLLLSVALLQPVKGGVIGLQWALRMHGFGGHDDTPETHPEA